MTDYHDKITWAVETFNKNIAAGQDAKNNLGLLGYIKKIAADGKVPAWARMALTSEARDAAEAAGFDFSSRMRKKEAY